MKQILFLTSISVLIFSGCKSIGPDYSGPPQPIPKDAFHAASNGSVGNHGLDQWWLKLSDSRLNQLVEKGLKHNFDIKIAMERVSIAHAAKQSIRSKYLPQVSINSSFTITRNSENFDFPVLAGGSSGFIPTEFDQWALESQVGWEIDIFGGGRREMESFRAQFMRDQSLYSGVKLAMVTEIVESYFTIAGIQAQLEALRENVDIQTKTLKMVQDRFDVGAGNKLDVSRTRSRLLTTQSQIPIIESALFAETRTLTLLLGLAPGEMDEEFKDWVSLPVSLPVAVTGLPSELIQRRPDIRAAEFSLMASNAQIGKTLAAFYPKFFLLGKPQLLSSTSVNLLDSDSFAWQFAPRIEWQIFSSGRNQALLDSAKSAHKVDLLSYEKLVKQAVAEVESSMRQLSAEKQQFDATFDALEEMKQTVSLVKAQYESGASSFLDYLVEQQRYTEMNQLHKQRQLSMILSWIRLHKALGGGWDGKV